MTLEAQNSLVPKIQYTEYDKDVYIEKIEGFMDETALLQKLGEDGLKRYFENETGHYCHRVGIFNSYNLDAHILIRGYDTSYELKIGYISKNLFKLYTGAIKESFEKYTNIKTDIMTGTTMLSLGDCKLYYKIIRPDKVKIEKFENVLSKEAILRLFEKRTEYLDEYFTDTLPYFDKNDKTDIITINHKSDIGIRKYDITSNSELDNSFFKDIVDTLHMAVNRFQAIKELANNGTRKIIEF